MTPAPTTIEQLQREQIRDLKQQLFALRQQATKRENDYNQLQGEYYFLHNQNDNLVLKLQTARREIDHWEHTQGFKIPAPPEQETAPLPETH